MSLKDLSKVSAILFQHGTEVFLVRTVEGSWWLPGGHAHRGETPFATAMREVQEEIGWVPPISHLHPPVVLREEESGVQYSFFHVETPYPFTPITLQSKELLEFRWVSLDDLPSPLHPALAEFLSVGGVGE